jgi:hypothetical protein
MVTYGTVASAAGPREFCRKRTGGEESPPPRVNPPLAFPAATCKQLREHLQDGRGGDDMRRDRRLRNWAGVCRIIGLKGMGRPIVGLKGFLMQIGLNCLSRTLLWAEMGHSACCYVCGLRKRSLCVAVGLILDGADTVTAGAVQIRYDTITTPTRHPQSTASASI